MTNRMEATRFERRLTKTVAWRSLQCLEEQSAESEEFSSRIAMRHKSRPLLRRSVLLEKRGELQRLLDHLRLARTEDPEELKRKGRLLLGQGDVNPIYPLHDYLRIKSYTPASIDSLKTDLATVVKQLSERRAQLLQDWGADRQVGSCELANGKLLQYGPDFKFCDRASHDISYGYSGVNNAPPWDTWICFTDPALISWVPPSRFDFVRLGIDVNPVDCSGWVVN